jgi:hypothetical protein
MDEEEVQALVAPSSRPTLSDSPRALAAEGGLEDDERAFFRAGEEGRYEGGPATLVPIAFDDEEPEPALPAAPPDPHQLARRVRNARRVALFVGALGAVAAVALVRSTWIPVQAPEPVSGPVSEPVPVPVPVSVSEPMIAPSPEPMIAPSPEPTKPIAVKPAPSAERKSPMKPRQRVAAAAEPITGPEAEAPRMPPTPPPAAVPGTPPPTAAFPPAS